MSESPEVDCEALFRKIDIFLDRELPQHELDQLEAHLHACLPCAGRRDFEQQLRNVIRDCMCSEQAPDELVERIRAALEVPVEE